LRARDDVCLHFEYRNLIRHEHHVIRAARSTREALLPDSRVFSQSF